MTFGRQLDFLAWQLLAVTERKKYRKKKYGNK